MTNTRDITDIITGIRHRRDLGDIDSLARSIADVGLLHPIVIRKDGVLIAGERRLTACKQLGWSEIPVTVVDLGEIVRGELAENAERKDFLPSEIDAIRRALEPIEKAAARERMSEGGKGVESFHTLPGKSRDKIGAFAGVAGRTVDKIANVVEAAEADPEKFGHLVKKMDDSGKVDGAYKELKKIKKQERNAELAAAIPAASKRVELFNAPCLDILKQEAGSVDWVITDPPYPEEFLPCYDDLARAAAHILKPGGSLLCMVGQSYLPSLIERLSKHLTYHWTLAYLTPGGQATQLFPRKVNTFWKPILWFTKGEYNGEWIGDVSKSDVNDNDKSRHEWGQSESGMRDLMKRFVKPGDSVLDPFMGAGTTGAVAIELGCRFIGFDIDVNAYNESLVRLSDLRVAA
jgi:ParB/RepB/Spo0J family partition protein